MPPKLQSTSLNRNVGSAIARLEVWALNPWRRYSLFLIILLLSFFLGTTIGMINGTLALMDPLGALLAVLTIEAMIRFRRNKIASKSDSLLLAFVDMARIGFLYGLLIEGFKLL